MTTRDPISSYQAFVRDAWGTYTQQILDADPIMKPMLAHHFLSTGKLLRPALTLAFYDCLQGQTALNPDNTSASLTQSAIAIELLHNATLVHDDLQDGDETRRGIPTVWKAFNPYQAINTGSALYFYAQKLLLSIDQPAEVVVRLSQLLSEQTIAIIQGQAAEYTLWDQFPESFEDARAYYIDVVERKTSALFAIPLMSAAIMQQETQETIEGLHGVAAPLGALFQIQDDILDLYGEKGRGSAGNDIAEGKPSLLVLHFLHHADKEDAKRLKALLTQPREECAQEDIDWAIDAIRDAGSLAYCLEALQTLHQKAHAQCTQLHFKQENHLNSLLDQLVEKILQPIQHLLG